MAGPEFHQTGYGRRFFDSQLPKLIENIGRLASAMEPEVRLADQDPWNNNELQFARLLCEIVATQDKLDYLALLESMDLEREQLDELFERAHKLWEEAKGSTPSPFCDHPDCSQCGGPAAR